MKAVDPRPASTEAKLEEYYEHPSEGFISFDQNTRQFNRLSHSRPVELPEGFSKKQPYIRTCSEPVEGNLGCPKWAGCPFKAYPHVGPGLVIMKKHGTVSFSNCYDYYETTRAGKPTSQLHHVLDGWGLDTTRTTIDVLGRTGDIQSGKLNVESSRQAVMASKPRVWQMEVGGLLPPWWWLMKDKGLKLPNGAARYPELVEAYRPKESKKRGKSAKR